MDNPNLLKQARLEVRRHFSRHIPPSLHFHDLQHTLSVTRDALAIGRASGLAPADLLAVELAALFHDTGYAFKHKGHEAESQKIAAAFLHAQGAPALLIKKVVALINATRVDVRPRTLLQQVLCDADSSKAGQADFEARSELLRMELEATAGIKLEKHVWGRENLRYLEAHRFHTPYAQKRYGAQKSINLERLRKRLSGPARKLRSPTAFRDPLMDRDLSWLSFNDRVLQEATDERVPLLERIKFLAIYSSNLDEFYRVRVASLLSLMKLGKWDRTALQVPPGKRVERINHKALAQQRRFGALYREQLLPALAAKGVRIHNEQSLTAAQRDFVKAYAREHISPLLVTATVRPGNAPFIEDRKLYMVCRLKQKGRKKQKLVLVNVPSSELGRFLVLPAEKGRTDILFLDDAMRIGLPAFFSGFKLTGCHSVKLSRDAELYLDEEFAETMADKVRRSLRKRLTGVPARFLFDGAMPPSMLKPVRDLLGLKKTDLVPGGRYHHLSDLMKLPVSGRPELRDKPLKPLTHPVFSPSRDPFGTLRRQDVLMHFPYHDFGTVVQFVQKAARDAHVKRIAITLYRVAEGSKICEALIEAVGRGKEVLVFVEVQARFDERSNLFWGEALQKAGARVIYSYENLKVHCKLLLVERREGRALRRYAYLGTGNFNERTSRTYTDMGLLTAHEGITREVAQVFEHLKDQRHKPTLHHLMMAPLDLRSGLEHHIDKEIAHALSGKPASILLKLNSLEDRGLIAKLYNASRAGVDVRLIIRGICCLVTGVKGSSTNIQAISIIDRYLEHARAFVFHNAGTPVVYLASADWMERNMDRRVEVAFPLLDTALRQEVLDLLELQWQDNVKSRLIDKGQSNPYCAKEPGDKDVQAQTAFHARLAWQRRKG
jgi:polyphosphate kinase